MYLGRAGLASTRLLTQSRYTGPEKPGEFAWHGDGLVQVSRLPQVIPRRKEAECGLCLRHAGSGEEVSSHGRCYIVAAHNAAAIW